MKAGACIVSLPGESPVNSPARKNAEGELRSGDPADWARVAYGNSANAYLGRNDIADDGVKLIEHLKEALRQWQEARVKHISFETPGQTEAVVLNLKNARSVSARHHAQRHRPSSTARYHLDNVVGILPWAAR